MSFFHSEMKQSNYQTQSTSTPSSSSSSSSKISPAILFIIIILAVIFFISGFLHLLVRFFMKHRSSSSSSSNSDSNRHQEMSESSAFQRQLQQLFQLHDSGLDQVFIDALPVFHYKELMDLKEPFDCAVCLCEFSQQDKLRLLPFCSHAFHIDCIDTWLLSNSTCPLCRGTLYSSGFPIENPVFDFEDQREGDRNMNCSGSLLGFGVSSSESSQIVCGKRVFSVRLGKFRDLNGNNVGGGEKVEREKGETSSSNLGAIARRCYSMGSYQYVVADSDLQVKLSPQRFVVGESSMRRIVKGGRSAQNGSYVGNNNNSNFSVDEDGEGKKMNNSSSRIACKNDSFSVSKIWQWSSSKKSKYSTSSSDTHMVGPSSTVSMGFA